MLDALAARVGRPADRAEGRVEIGDGFRRQATRAFLRRTDRAVDLGGLDRVPLAGAQPIGGRILRNGEKHRRSERACPPEVNTCEDHAVNCLRVALRPQ